MPKIKDLSGQRFGKLVVQNIVKNRGHTSWLCKCDCGKSKIILSTNLMQGYTKSCGCLNIDFINNKRFGRWLVVKLVGRNKHQGALWECLCDCGTIRNLCTGSLKNGSQSCGCRLKDIMKNKTGDRANNWKGGLTSEYSKDRASKKCQIWKKSVFERDNYTCQICKDDRGGNLNAHHINSFHKCKDLRFDINNGITLCKTCHQKFHKIFGFKNNTKNQFEIFKIQHEKS